LPRWSWRWQHVGVGAATHRTASRCSPAWKSTRHRCVLREAGQAHRPINRPRGWPGTAQSMLPRP
jgi:hypothetical protein